MAVAFSGAAQTPQTPGHTVTVMSYNILHGTNAAGEDTLSSQAAVIRKYAPDFVGLQEVDVGCRRSSKVDEMEVLGRLTGMRHVFAPHFDYQGGQYGLGILSRHELSDVRNDRITVFTKQGTTETRALLSAVATLDGGTTVVVASVHMGLDQKTRLLQAREITGYLRGRGAPVILTGDFNAEPDSEAIGILEKSFNRAASAGPEAFTFSVVKPVKTIDFIMVDKASGGVVSEARVLRDARVSDHFPVVGRVTFGG